MGKSGELIKTLLAGAKVFKSPSKENSRKDSKNRWKKGSKNKCMWGLGKSSSRSRESEAPVPAPPGDLVDAKIVHLEGKQCKGVQLVVPQSLALAPVSDAKLPADTVGDGCSEVVPEMGFTEDGQMCNREEWAAAKIQAAFRCYLAHRAFRALKAVVRLQALARGRIVRRQAATTLKCMQALVRLQALLRGRRVRMSELGQLVQKHLQQTRQQTRKSAEGWVSSMATVQELQAKAQSKQDAVMKRQRALVYAFSEQLQRCVPKQNSPMIDCEPYKNNWGWIWLERWMAARPWENTSSAAKEHTSLIPAVFKSEKAMINTETDKYKPDLKKETGTEAAVSPSTVAVKSITVPPRPPPPPLPSFTRMVTSCVPAASTELAPKTAMSCVPLSIACGVSPPTEAACLSQPTAATLPGLSRGLDMPQTQSNSPPRSPVSNLASNASFSPVLSCSPQESVYPSTFSPREERSRQPQQITLPPLYIPDPTFEEALNDDLTSEENVFGMNGDSTRTSKAVAPKKEEENALNEGHQQLAVANDVIQPKGSYEETSKYSSSVQASAKNFEASTTVVKQEQGESQSPSVPSYMATTQSSKAKVRSHNSPSPSPKQKPDAVSSLSKRRRSISGSEGKSSPVAQRQISHGRVGSKGQLASLRDGSSENSPR